VGSRAIDLGGVVGEAGDIVEAGVVNGKITFTPKSLIDRHLDEGLEDAAKGRTHGTGVSTSGSMAMNRSFSP
jgi:hypothetical protein